MLLSSTIMTVGPKVLEVHWQCKEGEKLRKISDSLKKKKKNAGVLFKSLLDECKFTRKVAVRIKYAWRCAADRSSDMSPGNGTMGMRLK